MARSREMVRKTCTIIFAIVFPQTLFLVLPFIVIHRDSQFQKAFFEEGFTRVFAAAVNSIHWKRVEFWALVGGLFTWGTISLVALGGRPYTGPPTTNGFVPHYTHSGFRYYVISMLALIPALLHFPILPYYYDFTSLIGILIAISFPLSLFLHIKGVACPSPGENYVSGNPLIDFFQGVELYPRIFGLDLKTLVNCRVCLFLLQIIFLGCWKANAELHQLDYARGEINWALTTVALLQTIYLGKWFYWEDGYKQTIDIIVLKLGFYLASACLSLLPSFYSLYSLYLVKHTPLDSFGPIAAAAVFALGMAFISLTFVIDRQRQVARQTDGKCNIWGKPAKVIRATYKDVNGKEKRSLLLCSGFWGQARHINYLFEIGLFVAWGIPALSINFTLPLGTVVFVSLILWNRARRDDQKCRKKYGKFWDEYCREVPYRIVPYVY